MAYKLAEEDKLCGIEYPTYEGYKLIPKATCEMLETQCGGIEIVFNCDKKKENEKPTPKPTPQPEPTPEEPKPQPEEPTPSPEPQPEEPKPEEQKPEDPKPNPEEPQPEEPKPQPNPVEPTPVEPTPTPDPNTGGDHLDDDPKPTPTPTPNPVDPSPTPDPVEPTPEPEPAPKPVLTNEELDEIVSSKLRNDGTLGKYITNKDNKLVQIENPTPEEIEAYKKEITDKVGDIPELEGYTVEVSVDKIPTEPEVGSEVNGAPLYTKVVKITKPNGEVYQSEPIGIGTTTKEKEFSILEVMPKVEGIFSIVTHNNGVVTSVTDNSTEHKEEFERGVITTLKNRLPEGVVVEAVLSEPYYREGSELITGKANYSINVRVTVDGKVYEQEYKVPHIEEEALVVTDPNEPELNLNKVMVDYPSTYNLIMFSTSENILRDFVLEKPGDIEKARDNILAQLNDESKNPSLKGFKKRVDIYRARTIVPKVGDNVYRYDNGIDYKFLITLVSPGNKVYRKFVYTSNINTFVTGDTDSYVRGTYG